MVLAEFVNIDMFSLFASMAILASFPVFAEVVIIYELFPLREFRTLTEDASREDGMLRAKN